jgi:hypothetical protein
VVTGDPLTFFLSPFPRGRGYVREVIEEPINPSLLTENHPVPVVSL